MGESLKRPEFVRVLRLLREEGKRVVFTNGCFDLIHVGHVRLLKLARSLGDVLAVGVNSDQSGRGLKGAARPIVSENERAEVLASLSCVDYVTLFQEATPLELISAVVPHVLVKGGDYRPETVVGRDVVERAGGIVYIVPLVKGFSTTGLLRKLMESGEEVV